MAVRCFNPLPPSKRGETTAFAYDALAYQVSIRSPRRNEGRPRHDLPPVLCGYVSIRSPRRNEGRLALVECFDKYHIVSIRSPRRNEGRLFIVLFGLRCSVCFNPLPPSKRGETLAENHGLQGFGWFQSAPPVETRGDCLLGLLLPCLPCFNPLPPSKRGETNTHRTPKKPNGCFNPLPPSKRGETSLTGTTRAAVTSFNPLPPSKRGETRGRVIGMACLNCFNPLPPSKRGETAGPPAGLLPLGGVSIRSPRRNEGRLVLLGLVRRAYRGFNPLPPSKRGETSWMEPSFTHQEFQSAPPVETRGDAGSPAIPSQANRFNPLPPSKRGETCYR